MGNNFFIDYFISALKRALEGNEEVRVEFGNEEDNINYVLDVCNNFKKELEKDGIIKQQLPAEVSDYIAKSAAWLHKMIDNDSDDIRDILKVQADKILNEYD